MRRRYRYSQTTKEMEEVTNEQVRPEGFGVLVSGDISPFKSSVDGSVITGRRGLREHNKRNQVTFTEDFRGHWDSEASKRAKMHTGDPSFDRTRRIAAIRDAVERTPSRRR